MKLLIHDYPPEKQAEIAARYKDWAIISDTGNIRPCIGCFRCWTSGTGKCVFKDGYENMCSLIHDAEEMVVVSRYTYGGFSGFVKNVFDRCIGYVLPEFETAYGEMHHKRRFPEEKPVTFCFRGTGLTEEDKEKARRYVAAVCRNLRGKVKDVIFEESSAEEKAEPSPRQAEKRSGILLVDGSLRGKRSNTNVFLKRLQADLKGSADLISLSSCPDLEIVAEAVSRAETVVLGVPLYVDGLPAPVLRLMETIKECRAGDQCRLYAVVNNGLYESRQNVNLLSMIRDWCADAGFLYRGSLAIGAGEVMGTLMRDSRHVLWPAHNVLSGLSRLAAAIDAVEETETIYADAYLFPRWLYILIANVNWQRLKRAEKKKQ